MVSTFKVDFTRKQRMSCILYYKSTINCINHNIIIKYATKISTYFQYRLKRDIEAENVHYKVIVYNNGGFTHSNVPYVLSTTYGLDKTPVHIPLSPEKGLTPLFVGKNYNQPVSITVGSVLNLNQTQGAVWLYLC